MMNSLVIRLARRELRGGLHGFRVFLACLALGVAAIAGVGTVRSGIAAGLAEQGAAILGGDAEATFTYRFADEDEQGWMDSIATHVSETIDFRSMVVTEGPEGPERALTQLRAVDDEYPLVGSVRLTPEMRLDEALDGMLDLPGAVMEPVLADRLGLMPSDTFQLGERTFVLSAILESYPDNGGNFGLGPRSIVRTQDLEGSGLLSPGTLFDTQYRLTLPEGTDLQALEEEAESRFGGQGLRWRDARNGAGGTAVFVDRIGTFLILIGLSGLAVGGVGVSAAVRSYLDGKTGVIATLKTLGATRRTVFLVYLAQIGVLTVLGIVAGLILGAGVPILLAPVIAAQLPIPAEIGLYPRPLFEAATYGILAALIFTLWPLGKAGDIRAATLFRDAFAGQRQWPRMPFLIATALLIAALVGSAIWFSGSAWLTLWIAGGIIGSLALLTLSAWLIRFIARRSRSASRGRPALRLALGSIGARGGETTSVVLSLGLGLSVLAAVGQIEGNLRQAFDNELPAVAPSYFFVDIQPDQIDGFRSALADDAEVSRVDAAPMLRGIITRINDEPAADFADGHWVVQGDRGISYDGPQPDNTVVTEGEWWPEDYAGDPLISFSAEEAAEIGLSIGDTMTLNVLGRDITGTVASFREVTWEDAGIGFVLTMNQAALAGAPHSWIATVYTTPDAEARILRDLATSYPNITAIRIRDAIDRVTQLVEGISAATRYGALATLITGFLVLIGAAAAGERARTFEAAVLKTIGASRRQIVTSFILRSALLGLAAGVVALAAGLLGGWAVQTYIMESEFTVIWRNALVIVGGGILVSTLAGLGFAIRPLRVRPARVLRARE